MAGKVSRAKAPDHTYKEAEYLQRLVSGHVPVRVRAAGNQEFEGTIEFFDVTFIRLTRHGEPNLLLYKQDLKYLVELPGHSPETSE